MRAIGYARVSTDEQASDGVSLAAQFDVIEKYSSLHNLNLVEVISDPGESSKTLKRPGMQRLLAALDRKECDCVVVAKLDRLTRSLSNWLELVERYFGHETIRLCSFHDHVDTKSPSGRLMLNIMMSVAQWEREAISERTKDALGHKIRNGERVGRVRYGYSLAADGITLVEDSYEQLILKEMRTLRGAGWKYREITGHLNRNCKHTRSGKLWDHSTIRCILNRRDNCA